MPLTKDLVTKPNRQQAEPTSNPASEKPTLKKAFHLTFLKSCLENVRENVIKAPEFDPRNIVDLVERYGDAHINDCGWREVDSEEWYIDS